MLVTFSTVVIARIVSEPLYNGTEALVSKFVKTFSAPHFLVSTEAKEQAYNESTLADVISYDSLLNNDPENLDAETVRPKRAQNVSLWLYRGLFLAPIAIVAILMAVRPPHFPFAHMSGSIPFTLFDIWSPYSQDMCQAGSSRDFVPFPLPNLISPTLWEPPNGHFPGWMPSINASDEPIERQNTEMPSWLPRQQIHGFERWYERSNSQGQTSDSGQHYTERTEETVNKRHREHHHKHHHKPVKYDPVQDPMRISNLDGNVLAPIVEAMKENTISIKHVVILSLESTRKDVFPLKKESNLHDAIMQTHGSTDSAEEAYLQLTTLTPNAKTLTGESDRYDLWDSGSLSKNRTWRDLNENKGGINVIGAFTGSSSTFKSMLGTHCGVEPLPVDFTVEAGSPIYQPCLPSILQLFNRNKKSPPTDRRRFDNQQVDFNSWPWKSVFVQSITEQYDRQDELNRRVGFDHVISKETLLDPASKHYPPTEPESNYFGFPESQVKPYIYDVLQSAKEENTRLFLSHFTSSTHHPWNTPEADGETVDYLKPRRWRSEHPLNKYLNTIRYQDKWVGEVMDMLEDFDMANETLVVIVGDQ